MILKHATTVPGPTNAITKSAAAELKSLASHADPVNEHSRDNSCNENAATLPEDKLTHANATKAAACTQPKSLQINSNPDADDTAKSLLDKLVYLDFNAENWCHSLNFPVLRMQHIQRRTMLYLQLQLKQVQLLKQQPMQRNSPPVENAPAKRSAT